MNKIPRFMKEYANYQISSIQGYDLMQEKFKTYGIDNVRRVLRNFEKGLITVEEAMDNVTHVFRDLKEEANV